MKLGAEVNHKFVVDIGALQAKVKKKIVDDITRGVPREKTDEAVAKFTHRLVKQITNPQIKRRFIDTISKNYKEWYAFYQVNTELIAEFQRSSQNLVKAVDTQGFGGVSFKTETRQFLTDERIATARIADYQNKVKKAQQRLINELSAKDFKEPSSGTLRNFAEIRVRWEANRGDISKLRAEGVKLVWSSSHANASTRCSPWQGKLYSLDQTYGIIDGISYEPLENAMQGDRNDGNGLLGYNCRHRLIPYFKGSTPPQEYSKEEIKKEQAIDQKQRYMERRIRMLRERAEMYKGIDRSISNSYVEEAEERLKEYRAYSATNNRTAYIYRTQIKWE